MITYDQAIDYLYTQMPMFQRQGASAYKPGLDTSMTLDDLFGNSHRKYATIHIAGTNGKGSTAHTLAAILQSAGYRVGLYTSPHLVDFRERIRVNGKMITRGKVVDFVERYKTMNISCRPSFFELTMIMAFEHFAAENVDIAVIETGLGGRLDSTNIITPVLSVITNISFDHTAFLGNTLESIATEKAGIIKQDVPVVIGEDCGETRPVFMQKAANENAPIIFVQDAEYYKSAEMTNDGIIYTGTEYGDIVGELTGDCQKYNTATILAAVSQLQKLNWAITPEAVKAGFANVSGLTGLAGRWMKLQESPCVICDTGHNTGGWRYLSHQLENVAGKLIMVIGFVNDKDISHILDMMPRKAEYIFTCANIPRALPAESLAAEAFAKGLCGKVVAGVGEAYRQAIAMATSNDTVFVGGSTFVVADLLQYLKG